MHLKLLVPVLWPVFASEKDCAALQSQCSLGPAPPWICSALPDRIAAAEK